MLKSSATYFLGKATSGVVALLSVFVFTRILSPQDYGSYALTVSVMNVAYAVLFLWISLSLARFYEQHQKGRLNVLHGTVSISFIAAMVLLAILQLIFLGISGHPLTPINSVVLFLLVTSYAWYELNLRVFNAELDVLAYSKLVISRALLSLLFGLFLFYIFGLNGIFYALILSSLLLPFVFSNNEKVLTSLRNVDVNILKEFLAYGLPLAVTSGLTLVIDFSDRFLIAELIDKEQSGLYSASYDFVLQTLGFLVGVFYLSFFPILNKNYENGEMVHFQKNQVLYLNLTLVTLLPVLVIYWTFSSSISGLFFGTAYQSTSTVLIPLMAIAISLGTFKAYVIDLVFLLRKKTLIQIPLVLIVAITNVVLNLYWIPKIGVIGAVYATLVAFILGIIFGLVACVRFDLLPKVDGDTYKILLASVLMYLFGSVLSSSGLNHHVFLLILFVVIIYALILIGLNVLNIRQRGLILGKLG